MEKELQVNGVDADLISVMDSYPMLREMPPQEGMCVMYFALGMTPAAIASTMSISKQMVLSILKKHDITRVMRRGLEMQKLFLASSLGSITIAAISEIKKKSADFSAMSLPALVNLIKTCSEVQKNLNPQRPQDVRDDDDLIDALRDKKAVDMKSGE